MRSILRFRLGGGKSVIISWWFLLMGIVGVEGSLGVSYYYLLYKCFTFKRVFRCG